MERALACAGRVFGAAQAVELVRTGRYDAEAHGEPTWRASPSAAGTGRSGRSPRRWWWRWTARDLRVGGLAEFLDGGQKLVLVVRGDAPRRRRWRG